MSTSSHGGAVAANNLEILEKTGPFANEVVETSFEETQKRDVQPLRAVRFSEIESKPIKWLWNPFLALGTFNILEGEEGIGKTFLTCALACAVGSGKGLPLTSPEDHIEPSNVLLISAEDSLSHVLKPRLESMNAPTDKIIAIDEGFILDREGIFRLDLVLAEYEPKLVIIDPLFSYTGRISLDRDNEVRSITDALKRLAEKSECSIVGIRHIGKSKGLGDARNAGLNGIGWRASARSVLLIGKNPENEHQKALCQTKNNLAPRFEKSLGFEIRESQFFWTGESSLTAGAMLSALKNESGEERHDRQDAAAFLRDCLRPGEQLSNDILAEARQCGISERTLHRAKKELNIHSRKEGFGSKAKWFWSLPEDCQEEAEDCHINISGNLKANDENKHSFDNNLTEDCQANISGNVSRGVGNLSKENNSRSCNYCSKPVQSYSVKCPNCGELPLGI